MRSWPPLQPGGTAEDTADIWTGFAVRGLGVFAEILNEGTGANDTRVVQSFLRPGDPIPTFSINDVSVVEGIAGTTTATFTVTLANPAPAESRVSFATADGTATSGTTFTQGGAIAIPAVRYRGSHRRTIESLSIFHQRARGSGNGPGALSGPELVQSHVPE